MAGQTAPPRGETGRPFASPPAEAEGRAGGWLAARDPRAKLLAAFGLSLGLALTPSHAAALAGLTGGLMRLAAAGRGRVRLGPRQLAANGYVVFLWLSLLFRIAPGPGPWLAFHPEGAVLALLVTLKANAILVLNLVLLGATPVSDLAHALAHFRVPPKLVALLLLFHRYLHVLGEEYQRMRRAMRARAFVPGNDLHTYLSLAHLVGGLLVKSLERAERVYGAMPAGASPAPIGSWTISPGGGATPYS